MVANVCVSAVVSFILALVTQNTAHCLNCMYSKRRTYFRFTEIMMHFINKFAACFFLIYFNQDSITKIINYIESKP